MDFHEEAIIKNYPIRNKAALLHTRRSLWLIEETGKVISRE